ncbi:hypothetical protein [Streptomyces albidoflavus]|uniref:hypothetical protein n=1 Tax=Streptomyces albidoflavus TaxID=1886 RepID=UPI0033D0B5EB
MTSTGDELVEQGWDEPWYRVRTDRFDSMTQVLAGLLDLGDFTLVLQRLEDA